MDNRGRLRAKQSIRTRLLISLLGLATASVLITAYLGVNSILAAGERVRQASGATLRAQAEESLLQLAVGEAQRNELILQRVQHDGENMARYAAGIFENPGAFAPGAYWRAEDHMFVGPDGQYVNGEDDVCSAFVPNFVEIDDEVLSTLEASAYLDFVFPLIYENDPNTVAIYFETKEEIVRYYPNVGLGNILPPDFRITPRPPYVRAAAENNPERRAVWTPVYEDATGQGLMVTAVAPIYTGRDEFVGVIGIDVVLKDIGANVEAARLLGGGYSFLVDDAGRAIALPDRGYPDVLGRGRRPGEFGTDLSQTTTEFASVVAKMMAGSTGFETVEVRGKELFVAYAPLESTAWSLASVAEAEEVLQAVSVLQEELETSTRSLVLTRVLPVGGGILALMMVVGLVFTNRLVDPIRKLAAAAQQIGAGQWDVPLPRAGNDEIGVLSRAFATMTIELRGLLEELEQRVAERTRGLQAASEVARATTSVLDPELLAQQVVGLARERFDLYYVGLFLVDEERRFAVLHAGTGEAGRRMLEQGHVLAVGGESMIGQCVARGEARIALDVGQEAVRFDNPLLPETRSEMALPLRSRGRVIGAMSVQSVEEAAFDEADIAVMQTMADQVAVAIDNARLFAEVQAALEEIEDTQRRYVRRAWTDYPQIAETASYETQRPDAAPATGSGQAPSTGSGQAPLGDAVLSEIRQTVERQKAWTRDDGDGGGVGHSALLAPIALRGEVIGALGVHDEDRGREWTDEEIVLVEAVAERMALAAENLRLFEETQRRAAREQVTREITDKMRRAADMDALMRITVQEMVAALGTSGAFVQLSAPPEPADEED